MRCPIIRVNFWNKLLPWRQKVQGCIQLHNHGSGKILSSFTYTYVASELMNYSVQGLKSGAFNFWQPKEKAIVKSKSSLIG
jgi:hypothetical protein